MPLVGGGTGKGPVSDRANDESVRPDPRRFNGFVITPSLDMGLRRWLDEVRQQV